MDNFQLTFELPRDEFPRGIPVDRVSIVVEFKARDGRATPLFGAEHQRLHLRLELEPRCGHEYRCLTNGEHRFDLWQADECSAGGDGEDLCFVVIPTGNMLDELERQPVGQVRHDVQRQMAVPTRDETWDETWDEMERQPA
jgi:hypothetical protein